MGQGAVGNADVSGFVDVVDKIDIFVENVDDVCHVKPAIRLLIVPYIFFAPGWLDIIACCSWVNAPARNDIQSRFCDAPFNQARLERTPNMTKN